MTQVPYNWEQSGPYCQVALVEGGWLVQTFDDVKQEIPVNGLNVTVMWQSRTMFVPDRDHKLVWPGRAEG